MTNMQDIGPPISSFTLVSSSSPSTCQDARLWISPDALYSLGCAPGSLKLVGVKDMNSGTLHRLDHLFKLPHQASSSTRRGDFLIPVEVWPSSKLKRQSASCSYAVSMALGSPTTGSTTLDLYDIIDGDATKTTPESIDIRLFPGSIKPRGGQSEESEVSSTVAGSSPSPARKPSRPVVQSPSMRRSSSSTPVHKSTVKSQQIDSTGTSAKDSNALDNHHATAVNDALLTMSTDGKVSSVLQFLSYQMLGSRYIMEGNISRLPIMGSDIILRIENIHPSSPVARIRSTTAIRFLQPGEDAVDNSQSSNASYAKKAAEAAAKALGAGEDSPAARAAYLAARTGERSLGSTTFASIGGLKSQMKVLEQLVINFDAFAAHNIAPPSGILLHGPPGTGKTALARAAATAANASFFVINGPDVVSEFLGESEQCLRGIFAAARSLAPSVIFMDEIDAIAPSRGDRFGNSTGSSVSARLVTTLISELDSIRGDHVIVLAATNRVETLDDSLRRPGRLDREVEVGVPSPAERLDILHKLLNHVQHELSKAEIAAIADDTHGFVGADMVSLCSEAAMITLRRMLKSGNSKGVTKIDFDIAKSFVRPSALREIALEKPKIKWSDVGGNDDLKQQLKEVVEWPSKYKDSLDRLGAIPPRGVLLYGPPGCSKTMLAKAVACEANMNFLAVRGPELLSKYVGESEKAVRNLFHKARTSSPAIIFFDEIDGMIGSRSSDNNAGGVDVSERILSQLLQEMDGLHRDNESLVVLAATNRPDCIDAALLRPGRFDRLLYVPPPDAIARKAIFEVHTSRMPLGADVEHDALAMRSEGYTGADIAGICQQAALFALEESDLASEICIRHFDRALEIARPSLSSYTTSDSAMFNSLRRHVV